MRRLSFMVCIALFLPRSIHAMEQKHSKPLKKKVAEKQLIAHILSGIEIPYTSCKYPGEKKSIVYHPGGAHVAVLTVDNTITIWDIKKGTVIKTIKNDKPISSIAYNPDGSLLLIKPNDSKPIAYDILQSKKLTFATATYTMPQEKPLGFVCKPNASDAAQLRIGLSLCRARNQSGTNEATAHVGNIIRLWSTITGQAPNTFYLVNKLQNNADITVLSFGPDHQLASGDTHTIKFWNLGALLAQEKLLRPKTKKQLLNVRTKK